MCTSCTAGGIRWNLERAIEGTIEKVRHTQCCGPELPAGVDGTVLLPQQKTEAAHSSGARQWRGASSFCTGEVDMVQLYSPEHESRLLQWFIYLPVGARWRCACALCATHGCLPAVRYKRRGSVGLRSASAGRCLLERAPRCSPQSSRGRGAPHQGASSRTISPR